MDASKVDFVKYNRDRLPQYRTETTVRSSSEGRWVQKRALSVEGLEHIRNLIPGGELLRQRLSAANLPSMVQRGDYVELEFIEGVFLESLLLQRAAEGDQEGSVEMLGRFRTYLGSLGTSEEKVMRGVVAELLSGIPEDPGNEMMPVADLDLTFDNVIIDREGKYWITDHEWVFDSPVPLSFILYRSLYVLYLKHERRLEPVLSFPEALLEAGVGKDLWEPYREACERFIDMVFGKDRPHVVPSHYRKDVHQLASLAHPQSREQQLYALRLELDATKTALDEMLVHAKLREERLHEQEKKLGELSNTIVLDKSSLAEKDGLLGTLRVDLESERLRISALHGQLEVERDHAFKLIQELEGEKQYRDQLAQELEGEKERRDQLVKELEGERTLSQQLKGELRLGQEDLRIARDALASLEITLSQKESQLAAGRTSIADLIKERDQEFDRLQVMTELFINKQADLMTMSDWARSMRLRLDFMESIPTIRRVEHMAQAQKAALDRIRSEGLWPTLKSTLLKASPSKLQRMFYRPEPSNMDDLEKDTHDRDVLVVFPVIPWEFRWQRPQQLVSRFAENGYTVLFVNMTLTPTDRRYLNDGEALGEVSLGRLREHIYEVRLRSLNRINVYHDRLKGADLNNLAHGLGGVMKRLSARSVTYLVHFPGWWQLAMMMRNRVPGPLVFDCMDDNAGFSNNSSEVVKRETRLMEKADLMVTSSANLFEKASTFNENTILVRNGTDFEMFNGLSPNGKLDGIRKPIIGYHGAISEWFDPDVVANSAEKHPEWNFVLVGSTLGGDVSRLKKLPNVHLLGEMPYQDLPGYLYYFDVCVIPFHITPLTLATNPVKFYEYISSGKPVVSIRLPEMERYADICYLYDDQEEFDQGIARALSESDQALVEQRIELARNSSWDQRFHEVKDRLDEMQKQEKEDRLLKKLKRHSPED